MATVPTLDNRQVLPEVSNPGYGSADVSAGAFGRGSANALIELGGQIIRASDDVSNAMVQVEQQQDEREYKKLDIELNSFLRTLQYGDGTKENPGYLATEGENAIDGYHTADAALTKKTKELSDSASNPRVKNMFFTSTVERVGKTKSDMLGHLTVQTNKANDDIAEARIVDAASDAATAWNDPSILNRSLTVGSLEIEQMGERHGWGKEVVESKQEEMRSKIIYNTVTAAISNNNQFAKKLLNTYGGEIDGVVKAKLMEQIQSQDRQNIADAERYQRVAEKAEKDRKEENFRALVISTSRGQVDMNSTTNALANDNIDVTQWNYLKGLQDDLKQAGGDENAFLTRQIDVLNGNSSQQEVLDDPLLDSSQKKELLSTLDEVDRRGGPLALPVVKDLRRTMTDKIGGKKSQFGDFFEDPLRTDKANKAGLEYDRRVLAGEDAQKVADELTKAWLDPEMFGVGLNTMKRPTYWDGLREGDKTTLTSQYLAALKKTTDAISNGELEGEDAVRQLELLEEYRTSIEGMQQ